MKKISHGSGVFSLDGFFRKDEADKYISMAREMQYEEAPIQTGEGEELFKSIRNNDRVIFDDESLAVELFDRCKEYLPQRYDIYWQSIGFNERFRLYRYTKDQYFKWHYDGAYSRSSREQSKLSFLIYLNEDYTGGSTEFKGFEFKPKQGAALFFPHQILHQGATISSGTKFVLRTDVMYIKLA